jgi:hypothetical protein
MIKRERDLRVYDLGLRSGFASGAFIGKEIGLTAGIFGA